MNREIVLSLSLADGDFEIAKRNESHHGIWTVMTTPSTKFAMRLQKEADAVVAPSLHGKVELLFENLDGSMWAGHQPLTVRASEFWATEVGERNGRKIPAMNDRKAWIASRAWALCQREAGVQLHPDLFSLSTEQILENVRMQRPSPFQRACARLYDAFGHPRILRVKYAVMMEAVSV